MEKKNLAVISSRLKCVDAISVEADKWIDKYVKLGYNVHLISGKFGEPTDLHKFELPEMDYKHPEVRGIKSILFSAKLDKQGNKAADILMNSLVKRIKGPLKNYLVTNKIQILSIEDALVSMKNLPLAVALSQIVKELDIPTISRYHYLPWDNPYFSKFDNMSKVLQSLPPVSRNIAHITTTNSAQEKLLKDRKINSKVIPNTIDLDKLNSPDWYNKDFRKDLGIAPGQLIFLQPTRVKRNKYVERSIKLIAELNDIMKKDNVLLITGSPVYSRGNYFEEIIKKTDKMGVKVIFANDRIFLGRHENPEQKFYSIHDAYVNADVILYPNTGDGFGNPVIEAAAYKKPIVVNSFPNLKNFLDKGFKFIVIEQKIDAEVVSDTYELVSDKAKSAEIVQSNFELLKKYFSSDVLNKSLMPILNEFDKDNSIMSRVAGLIPKNFWGKNEKMPENKKSKNKEHDNNKPVNVNNYLKEKKNIKGKDGTGYKKRGSSDLRNKKGGYKEPRK